ncbi:tRNA glutamyl-Q(34) synthetase GluQRS [Marivivens donghaensis]|uniref:tRNA glutamyl-Q(34) synthetase GluQRS n=1 Tax=Marivivens donghaensis TaxID=1699413 RepID=UPI00201FAD5B|nr:tRNA glutamyl-Q(34) synthetase GluQRS [Marivivens donghaensis]MCL7409969.1 tRNA glutamyl-Q(34) synthetase GluQRS [Marivivens donghaensis]MDN3705430.1 tRNA glutamyl-Q(34) synthetase GluQRS [Marivivens donghaensis]
MNYVTRFAPSPTGPLHLGHAFSALIAWDRAQANGGQFLLRIEDGDTTRCRPEWEALIYEDLHWLGLSWPEPIARVTDRIPLYDAARDRLQNLGLLYPCSCTRKDIQSAFSAPQEGVPIGPDGIVYPGTCRSKSMSEASSNDAIRLNMAAAIAHLGDVSHLFYTETGPFETGNHALSAQHLIENVGDIVLFRKDTGMAAYHLSVVVDDAAQNVTEAVRGADLIEATVIHRLLQALLDLPTPLYHHHDLIRDADGKRLAKRTDAKAISKFRAEGATPDDIRAMVGL